MISTVNCGLSLQATGTLRVNTHIIKFKVQCSKFKDNCGLSLQATGKSRVNTHIIKFKVQYSKLKSKSSKFKGNSSMRIYKLFLLNSKLTHALLASKRRLIDLQ